MDMEQSTHSYVQNYLKMVLNFIPPKVKKKKIKKNKKVCAQEKISNKCNIAMDRWA